jgi:predicted nucleic acid-binding protein
LIFLDSNILIYASGLHGEEDSRTHVARDIVKSRLTFGLSVQILHEFYDRATRPVPRKMGTLSHERTMEFVSQWRAFEILPLTIDLFDAAIAIRERYGFRDDDAIIAAARALGCDTLYSEDMQHQQRIESLTIINPFR